MILKDVDVSKMVIKRINHMKKNLFFVLINYNDDSNDIHISNEYVYHSDTKTLAHIQYLGKDHMNIPEKYIIDLLDQFIKEIKPLLISGIKEFNTII